MKYLPILRRFKLLVALFLTSIAFILLLLFFPSKDHLFLKRIKYKIVDNHDVFVETSDNLDIKKVSIKWICNKGEKFIFRDGKKVNRLDYVSGEYAFQIYYNDSLIKELGHVKNKWDNTNDYYFKITQTDRLTATFKVVGPDSISPLYWDEVFHPLILNASSIRKNKILISSEKDTVFRYLIDLTIEAKDYERITNNDNSKFSLKNAKVSINNTPLDLKKVKLVGATTLKYRRKSYKVSLKEPYHIEYEGAYLPIDNFRLLSLSMDPYYFHMFVSYSLMKEIGLFDLYFTFVELKINKETQGIYLLIEEPDHYALKRMKSGFILRRDFRFTNTYPNHSKNELEFESSRTDNTFADGEYLQSFRSIYTCLNTNKEKDLYESLNKHLNVNMYMKWMGINYLLSNGDYSDEIYFYSKLNNNSINFEIIPWDYDDIFRLPPHEGWDYRHIKIGNKLIYSIEDSLDLKIANDDYLYSKYLNNLHLILDSIDEQTIKKVFNEANIALSPYIKSENIRSMSRYDKTKINSYDEFIDHLNASCSFLIERRNTINNRLHSTNKVSFNDL